MQNQSINRKDYHEIGLLIYNFIFYLVLLWKIIKLKKIKVEVISYERKTKLE